MSTQDSICIISYEEESVFGVEKMVAIFNTEYISQEQAEKCIINGESNEHIAIMTQQAFNEIFYT